MKSFIEKLEENAKNFPNRKAVISSNGKELTYGSLNTCASKIYAFLKEKAIGKESFVIICLPRDYSVIASMIGTWKAGAAFSVIEKTLAPDRFSFIKKDCNCSLIIDEECFEKMMSFEPLSGHEEINNHDACCAIYTSGSTGTPKGIIHEYGKLAQMIEAAEATMFACANDDSTRFALVTPFDFAATITEIVPRLYRTHCIYIVDTEIVKNQDLLEKFFLENQITDTAMSSSLLNIYKNPAPSLNTILSTGESSNGVFVEGVRVINKYAMSESMFTVAAFIIDKPYDAVPVGKKCLEDIDIMILDENGKKLDNGKTGEVCFKNNYFRGYLHLPDLTKNVTKDGFFHSGDMGFIDKNGNLVIAGRKDDMVKINGNRIEPAEIESSVKLITGIKFAIAKGFHEKDRDFIVLYYLNKEAKELFDTIDMNILRKKLLKRLPYYMIPTYYVGLDEVPLNANNKINRKLLFAPNIYSQHSNYEAPQTNIEKLLCETMEQILHVDRVGRHDDFYLLGGDSLKSIEMISKCSNLRISVSDIFKYRTPAKLAEYLDNVDNNSQTDLDELNRCAMKHSYALLPEQTSIIDQQLFMPNSDMWNIPQLFILKKNIDIYRFIRAIDKVIAHHPSFGTKIKIDSDGNFVQYYDPECYVSTPIIEITQDEFDNKIKHLIEPFKLCNERFYKTVIYKTENKLYFYIDIHHIICDGTSITVLLDQFYAAYEDENCILPPDRYYLMLKNYASVKKSNSYNKAKQVFQKNFDQVYPFENWQGSLHQDNKTIKKIVNNYRFNIPIEKNPEHGNVFFMTAASIAMAHFNKTNHAMLCWTYNNRDDADKLSMTGLIYRRQPIMLSIDNSSTPSQLLETVKQQAFIGMENSIYPYIHVYAKQYLEAPIVLYQKDTASVGRFNQLIDEGILLFDKLYASNVLFCLNIFDNANTPTIDAEIHYSKSNYDMSSIYRYRDLFIEAIRFLDGTTA